MTDPMQIDETGFMKYLVELIQELSIPRYTLSSVIIPILKTANLLFQPDRCTLCLLIDDDWHEFVFNSGKGDMTRLSETVRSNIERLRHPEASPLYVPDVQAEPDYDNQITQQHGIRSFVGLGIYESETLLTAVLFLNYHESDPLNPELQQQRLRRFQTVLQSIYQDARDRVIFQQTQHSRLKLHALTTAWRQELVQDLYHRLENTSLQFDQLFLCLYQIDRDNQEHIHIYSTDQPVHHLPLTSDITQLVAKNRPVLSDDPAIGDPVRQTIANSVGTAKNWMLVPFTVRTPLGYVVLTAAERAFTPEDAAILSTLAHHISVTASLDALMSVLQLSDSSAFIRRETMGRGGAGSLSQQIVRQLRTHHHCHSIGLYVYPQFEGERAIQEIYPEQGLSPLPSHDELSHSSIFIEDCVSDKRYQTIGIQEQWLQTYRIQSLAFLPLELGQGEDYQRLGSLVLGYTNRRTFPEFQKQVLQAVANNITGALELQYISRSQIQNTADMRRVLNAINQQRIYFREPYDEIIQIVARYADADSIQILKYVEDSHLEIRHEYPDQLSKSRGLQITFGVSWDALHNEKQIYVDDVDTYNGNYMRYNETTRSEFAIPIYDYVENENGEIKSEKRGVLNLESQTPGKFKDLSEEPLFIDQFTNLIAIAWQNVERYEASERRKKLIETVHKVGLQIIEHERPTRQEIINTLLNNIVKMFMEIFQPGQALNRSELYIYRDEDGDPELEAIYDAVHDKDSDTYYGQISTIRTNSFQNGILQHVVQRIENENFEPYIVRDTQDEPLYVGDNTIRSEAVYPLLNYEGRLMALLNLESQQVGVFNNPDVKESIELLVREAEIWFACLYLFEKLDKDNYRYIGIMNRGILHDISNETGAIRPLFKKITRRLPDEVARELQGDITRIETILQRQADRNRQLSTVLDHHNNTARKEFSIPDIIEFVQNLLDTEADDRHHLQVANTIWDGETIDHIYLYVSEIGIQTCLQNLVNNALRAMPDGGTLTLAFTQQSAGNLAIHVIDEGHGIDKKQLGIKHPDDLFRPTVTGWKDKSGTGVGLFVVGWYVKQDEGEIKWESEVGVGTRFTMTFPYTKKV